MKLTLLINRENFEAYTNWDDTGWELIHMGRETPDPAAVITTNADILVVDAMMKLGSDIINNMPRVKLIQTHGVGYNGIDLEAARNADIPVCNCAGSNAIPVAEHAVLLMLAVLKGLRKNEDMVYADKQMIAKTACFENGLPELYGQRVGIIGYGAIGKALAKRLKAFDCEVCYYTRSGDHGVEGIKYIPLEELYSSCDIVSLNTPITPETTNMINNESLKLFKDGAILINTARGEIMDNKAVADALKSGKLGGLGTDVLAPEPYLPDNPILCLPEELRSRIVIAPHIAGLTKGTFYRIHELIRSNIEAVINGQKPQCIVNGL